LLKDFNKFRLTGVTLVGEDEIITLSQEEDSPSSSHPAFALPLQPELSLYLL
jgi:hypothetical protein